MKNETKVTSSGIIRNADKPRVGIVALNSLNSDVADDIFQSGIDLNYEEFCLELKERGIEEDSSAWYRETDSYDSDGSTYLFGDAWVKGTDGKYTIDTTKEFAASYSSNQGNVTIEYSRHTKRCHHTSPCYVMADGSGPCGDLDTPGDAVLAYTLPADWFRKDGE